MPAGELDHLEAALHLAAGVGEHLAVLVRDDRGQLVDARVDQLAEREQHLGPAGQRGLRTSPRTRPWRRRTAASTSAGSASTTSACCSPVAGFHTGPRRVPTPAVATRRRSSARSSSCDASSSRIQVRALVRLGGLVRRSRACVRRVQLGPPRPPARPTRTRSTAPAPAGRSRRARAPGRRSCARASASLARKSSIAARPQHPAPRLAALAARSTGSTSPSSRPVPASR